MNARQQSCPKGRLGRRESDRAAVVRQLREAIEVAVRTCRQPAPFGSTLAVETLREVRLAARAVVPLETEMIPVEVRATCWRDDVAFRVRFFNPTVAAGEVVYEVELL
jgi:hypothetical protein